MKRVPGVQSARDYDTRWIRSQRYHSSSELCALSCKKGEVEAEETVKKSRFIGRCCRAATFEDAKEFLNR